MSGIRIARRCAPRVAVACLLAVLVACGGGEDAVSDAQSINELNVGATAPASVDQRRHVAAAPQSIYVDARNGNDKAAGTATAPWRTLARVQAARLTAGQNIYLHCASLWRESLELTVQIAPNTTIAPYGNCASTKPTILGSNDFSGGWTKSNMIWSRSLPAGTPKIRRLFVSGVALRTAQWPNDGGLGAEFAKSDATSPSSKTQLVVAAADRSSLSSRPLTGAAIRVRSEPWFIESATVSAWTPATGTLTLSAGTTYTMEAGDGYVLQDQQWMLDAPGEFYHDTVANKLYVYPSQPAHQAALNDYVVEGAVRNVAMSIKGISGVSIQNVKFGGARVAGLLLDSATATVANGIESNNNDDAGVRVVQAAPPAQGITGASITNGRFNNNGRYGIDSGNAAALVIAGNNVQNTGTVAYVGDAGIGISIGAGSQATQNRINNTAYVGLRFTPRGGALISGNLISYYCLRMSDCAGLYTWNGAGGQQVTAPTSGATVSGNRLLPAKVNSEGAMGAGSDVVAGIFLDDYTSGVTVSGNIVHGAPIGIHVHNSSNNTIDGNQIWLTTQAALSAGMDIMDGSDHLVGNLFTRNLLMPGLSVTGTYPSLPTYSKSLAVRFLNKYSGLASITSGQNQFTGNTIVTLNGTSLGLATVSDGLSTSVYSPTGWQALNAGELSLSAPLNFNLYVATLQTESVFNGSFDVGLTNWTGWFDSTPEGGSLSLSNGTTGCSGNCAVVRSGGVLDSVYPAEINIVAGQPYLARFDATLSAKATIGTPYISRAGAPYDNLLPQGGLVSPTQMSGAAGETIQYEAFFVPATTAPARFNLKVATGGVDVKFDNVSLRPVTGYSVSKVSDYAAAVHGEIGTATTVTCAALGWGSSCSAVNASGRAVAMPVTVPAGESWVLLRSDAYWRR